MDLRQYEQIKFRLAASALKPDSRRRHLASDAETKAAERALMILAGHRTLNTPSPRS